MVQLSLFDDKSVALQILENMGDREFNEFWESLPYRVRLLCQGGLVNWREVLPSWYIGGNK